MLGKTRVETLSGCIPQVTPCDGLSAGMSSDTDVQVVGQTMSIWSPYRKSEDDLKASLVVNPPSSTCSCLTSIFMSEI